MTRNPWAVSLWAAGGLSFVVAFLLTLVAWQLTDYTTYDVAGVASIEAWVRLLVGIAAVAFTGAVTLAGMERMLRHRVDAPAAWLLPSRIQEERRDAVAPSPPPADPS